MEFGIGSEQVKNNGRSGIMPRFTENPVLRADHLAASGLYGPPDGDYRAILERPRLVQAQDVKDSGRF